MVDFSFVIGKDSICPYLPKGTHKTLDVMSCILRNKPKADVRILSAILQ